MTGHRRIAAVLLASAATVALGAGCSSDDATEDAGSADVSTTAATIADESTTTEAEASTVDETTTTAATATEAPDPCEALTAEEFGAVMGGPATATAVDDGEPACELRLDAGGPVLRLNVMTGMSAEMAVSQVDPMEFQPVEGIGEALVVSSEGRQAVMQTGGLAYRLTRWEGTVTPEQLQELMRSIVAG